MRARPHRLPTLLAALLGLSCAQPVITVGINLQTSACMDAISADPQRDPIAPPGQAPVDTLRITLTGDGLSAVTVITPFASDGASIPNVPLGTNRRITIDALAGGAQGAVRSRADSGPFDVASGGDLQLTLFLRVVDAFVYTGKDAGRCTSLITPRAGHQMTQLSDGTVLITGGYNIDSAGELHYLTQAEIYDPRAGTFSAVGSPELARAGHLAAPVLVNGLSQVLLMGGEGPSDSSIGPVGPFETYGQGAFVNAGSPMIPRERAAMALDVKTGYAVMAGGANGPDTAPSVTAYSAISYFNPAQDSIIEVDEPLAQPLADAVAVSRQNVVAGGVVQGGIVLLGGVDQNGNATAQIAGLIFRDGTAGQLYYQYQDDRTYESAPMNRLPTPRVHHAAVVVPADDSILVLGGSTSENDGYLLTTSAVTVVDPAQALVGNATETLSQARADGCATLLANGQVLYVGGAWGDASGVHSTASVDLIEPAGTSSVVRALEGPSPGGDWGLQTARHKAACLLLTDGTVLVTGGLQFQSGSPIALGSAEVYTPPGSN